MTVSREAQFQTIEDLVQSVLKREGVSLLRAQSSRRDRDAIAARHAIIIQGKLNNFHDTEIAEAIKKDRTLVSKVWKSYCQSVRA